MAQETAVHCWDAQVAHGRQQPIEPELAVDGVDEFLDVFLPTDLAERPRLDLGGAVQLRCTDSARSWIVTVRGGTIHVRRDQEPASTDAPLATVAASASDLLLLLWRRVALTSPTVETGGDAALAERLVALAELS